MENLTYAFQAVAPSFSIVLMGMLLKKSGILTDTLIDQGNILCFRALFPLLVFFNLYDAVRIDFSYLKVILFCVSMILVSALVLVFIVPRLVADRRKVSVMIQCIYRGNFMLYGLPFSKNLGGAHGVALATSIMAATLPILNVLGVFIYAAFAETGEKPDMKKTVINALKNPIIWGVVLGLIFYMCKLPMPEFLHKSGQDVAGIATPLAFLLLGGQFAFSSARKNLKLLTVGIFTKLIVVPCVFLWVAVNLFHITGANLIPVFVFLAAPTALTNYQMALQYDADGALAGDFLIFSMFFSAFTLFGFIYFLRGLGLI